MAIASVITGVIGLFLSFLEVFGLRLPFLYYIYRIYSYYSFELPLPPPLSVGWVIGVAGLVLGILALRRKKRLGIAITGIVLSSLVISRPVVGLIMWTIVGD